MAKLEDWVDEIVACQPVMTATKVRTHQRSRSSVMGTQNQRDGGLQTILPTENFIKDVTVIDNPHYEVTITETRDVTAIDNLQNADVTAVSNLEG